VKFPDHFSGVASDYAAFRPQYPVELFDWLASICERRHLAWDCACGSGQASRPLASHFDLVVGTDASAKQVAAAEASENNRFVVAAAEETPLADNTFDLVTVAQALHWFVGERFFEEVRRVVRPGGVFAAWTYGMPHIVDDAIERVVHDFINVFLETYWPPEVQMVLDGYASIDLPFEELQPPAFELKIDWTLDRFLGFARTWSAVGRWVEERGEDPVLLLADELEGLVVSSDDLLPINYRLNLRAGRVG
jgi:SAM-dependent methyltransferase